MGGRWSKGSDLDVRMPINEWQDIVDMMSMEPEKAQVDKMALLRDE